MNLKLIKNQKKQNQKKQNQKKKIHMLFYRKYKIKYLKLKSLLA